MKSIDRPYDLAIVGAGPAGAYLAYRLAQAGVNVALFDPKAPWEKPCGGGITHKAWSGFPLLQHPDLPRNEVSHSLQISATGRFFVIDQGHALFIVDRKDLGELMLDAATAAGAKHYPLEIDKVETWGSRVRLIAGKEEFFAGFVVGADGVHSVVRQYALGPLPKTRTLGAVVQFFEGGPADPTMIRVTPFPGYVWTFARRNCLCVGAGAMEPGHPIKPEMDRFMREFFPGRKPLGELRGAPLPYMSERRGYREPRVGPNWALIGDAAGFCDTLTGEGIIYAVWSADLLARAFLEQSPTLYEKAWRKEFGRHLRTGAWAATHLFSGKNIDRFFTAITVCPALRGQFMDFIWNLPPYNVLVRRLVPRLPQIYWQWHKFKKGGGRIDRALLGRFEHMADKLSLSWND